MKTRALFAGVVLCALLGAAAVALGLVGRSGLSLAAGLAAVVALFFAIGLQITGSWFGALVSERNVMSLSRMQAAIWTILLVAGYLNRFLWRLQTHSADPMAVGVPDTLWILSGISLASLAGTPLVLSSKSGRTPDEKAAAATASQIGDTNAQQIIADAAGTVFRNGSPDKAAFADLFQGDEVGDAGHVDLTKVQMMLFTLVLAAGYLVMLAKMTEEGGGDLPRFSEGIVTLLGISHAGYMANKAVDHSDSKK